MFECNEFFSVFRSPVRRGLIHAVARGELSGELIRSLSTRYKVLNLYNELRYLVASGLLRRVSRGRYELTEKGRLYYERLKRVCEEE